MVMGLKLVTEKTTMNTSKSAHSVRTRMHSAIEHTPIYDLAAYHQRERQFKRKKLLKNLFETTIFVSFAGFTFLTLFWGV